MPSKGWQVGVKELKRLLARGKDMFNDLAHSIPSGEVITGPPRYRVRVR
jgi:hypothetical protein